MSLPHRAPTGALRTQAGVKRSETPVKKSRKHIKFRRYDRNSVAPVGASIYSYILCRGFAPLHHLPVFCRPDRGLQSARISFAGVPLRCTICLCSVAPIGACNLLVHPLQGFRFALPLPVILTPLSGLAITIRINMMPISIIIPL